MRLNSNELHNIAMDVHFGDTWRAKIPAPVDALLNDPKFLVNCRDKLRVTDFVEFIGMTDGRPVEYARTMVTEKLGTGEIKLWVLDYQTYTAAVFTTPKKHEPSYAPDELLITKDEAIPDVKKARDGKYNLVQDGVLIAKGIEDEQEATLMALGQRRIGARYRVK